MYKAVATWSVSHMEKVSGQNPLPINPSVKVYFIVFNMTVAISSNLHSTYLPKYFPFIFSIYPQNSPVR